MAKFPGLTRRGNTFSLRTFVPKDLIGTYGRREIVKALDTADHSEAITRAKIITAEFAQEFKVKRSLLTPNVIVASSTCTGLSTAQRQKFANDHYWRRIDDEPYNRRQLLKLVRQNPGAFWSGKIVAVPDDSTVINGVQYSFWLDVCIDGETPLSTALFYAATFQQKKQLTNLEKQYGVGDCDAFILAATELAPNVSEHDLEKLALDLMLAEIRSLRKHTAKGEARVIEIMQEYPSPIPVPAGMPMLGIPIDTKTNPPVSEAKLVWLAEKESGNLSPEYKNACNEAVVLFTEIVGDKPVASIDKADVREFKEILKKLPTNRLKISATRALSARDAAAKAKLLNLKLIDVKTANKRLAILGDFFGWVQNNYDPVKVNPFVGASIAAKSDVRGDKDPFTTIELKTMFDAPLFKGCKTARDWQTPGSLIMRDKAVYWLPILALYTGARSNELCKLKSTDVRREDGVNFIDINEDAHTTPDIRPNVKSPSSVRRVPLHPDLIAFGFLDYAATRCQDGSERLFPELKPNANGKLQDSLGKHFRRFLIATGVKRPKIDFHSFRHTWVDACVNSGIPDHMILRLKGDAHPGTLARYGRGLADLNLLAEEVDKLQFKDLDLNHLRV